jgi:uncharacterized membrane protein
VSLDPATAPGPPRRRLPWVMLALVLSFALNLFFVGGALWVHLHKPPWRMTPLERIAHMSSELDLDTEHQQSFRRYFRTVFARLQLMRTQVQPLVSDAWDEIGKPNPDEAKIAKLFDQAAQTRRDFQRQLTNETLQFLATLTPKQRAKFVELARRPTPSPAQPINRGVSP